MAKTIQQQIQDVIEILRRKNIISMDINVIHEIEQLEEIAKHSERYRIAMENLTVGGSEFYNDLDRCVEWIQKRITERHNALKDKVRLQRRIDELVKNLPEEEMIPLSMI